MPRLLTIVPAEVTAEMLPKYLDTIGKLAERLGRRGQHLWVFQSNTSPGRFMEFAEGSDELHHWRNGPVGAEEVELASQLQEYANYQDAEPELWREVGPLSANGA